jgi:hypothetical protein
MKNLFFLSLIISFAASAADFNVNTVADFRHALIDASNNSEHDTIHVAPGHYKITGSTLLYAPGSGGDFGEDDSGLTIQGEDASTTVLDGMDLLTPLTLRLLSSSYFKINGLTFKNGKGTDGGGLSIDAHRENNGTVTITNSYFIENTAQGNGGGVDLPLVGLVLRNNRFVENKAGKHGGGINAYCLSCAVTGNEFSLNQAGGNGGGASLGRVNDFHTSVLATANRFRNNLSGASGGGLWAGATESWNNQFTGNQAMIDGGGAYIDASAQSDFSFGQEIYNNVLNSNWSGHQGGGFFMIGGFSLRNNTLTSNDSGAEGGGAYINNSGTQIFNNIIRGNLSLSDGNDLFVDTGYYSILLFNNNLGQNANFVTANSPDLMVTDTTNYSQGDNIKSDPLLTDDFHLQYGSPAIDAGDNAVVQNGYYPIDTDFEGDPRIVDGNGDGNAVVDIGADEDARGDINKDGCVDRTDADIILHNVRAGSEDPEDDINEDGAVNRADARVVVRLFKNPGGASCETVTLDYAKRAGGTNGDGGSGIAVDAEGNSVVTGHFSGSATFGAGEPNETELNSAGGSDIFMARFKPTP